MDLTSSSPISEAITRLRALTQVSIQAGWRFWDGDLAIDEISQPETWQTGAIAALNAKGHLAWAKGHKVRWFYQTITVPADLQGYPLQGLSLRIGLTWWAEVAQIFVNGQEVQEGDLFDCSTRLLLSQAVKPGEEFAIALRLISPGHDDGALVRSLCLYEAPDPRNRVSFSLDNEIPAPLEQKPDFLAPEPGFIADELAVLQLYLETFAPEKLEFLAETISQIDWSLLPTPHTPHPTPQSPHPTPHTPHPTPPSRLTFDQSLAALRDRLLPLSDFIKQRTIKLLGHAHLDMAWLWPISETWTAAERTFESVLKLQQDFPELIFCHSTPALYEWIEQNRPELFQRIQQQVKAGVWEPIGGIWVEPELNLISGESIARHILYGQRYFQEKFGSISPIAWLPDSFGFTWQLPQLLKQGGIDYFVTQKLRWNDTTKFPYEVFKWQSPDGTEIFSLMSGPIGEGIDPVKMATYACEWESKTGIPTSLWLPGVGDHGGGPTRDMLEVARRWQQSPFFPQLEFTSALEYLREIEKAGGKGVESGVWGLGVEDGDLGLNGAIEPLSINAESQSINHESQSISDESQIINAEPQNINAEPQNINDESQTLALESQSISAEPQALKREPLSISDEAQTLKREPLSINDEPQTILNDAQNNSLLTPHTPHPTPHYNTPPTWNSDLYLEFHRGCYTTHADQKWWNRRCEQWLYVAEVYASCATIAADTPYPKAKLEMAWKQVLFNQFHDILPGSAIQEVFEDADQAWRSAGAEAVNIMHEALKAIAAQISLPPPPHPNARAVVVFNPSSWERTAIVDTSLSERFTTDAEMLAAYEKYGQDGWYPWQICAFDGQEVEAPYCSFRKAPDSYGWGLTFLAENIPALGYRCFWMYPRLNRRAGKIPDDRRTLENKFLRVTINPTTGDLASIYDKVNQREVLNGAGNQLQAFRDEGQYWDAWNIDPSYESHPLPPTELISISPSDQLCVGGTRLHNSLVASISVERKIGQSVFMQTYMLERESPVLKIQTSVDWKEPHILVKAAFPLNLEADYTTYEIPCGVIQRTTKPESAAEKAQWEVPAMHWADLSDGKYGVSLLNDCKYGYDAKPNQLRLALLRGSEFPDPEADKGHHSFTYAIYPHAGDWKAAQTVQKGYELNLPLQAIVIPANDTSQPKTLPPKGSLLNLGANNLVLTAFKQSEDSPNEWILRCYECHGESAQLNFQSDLNLKLEGQVDLLERAIGPDPSQTLNFRMQPWAISSFKVMTH
nr:alpha-mannosidase [Kovacikia minuta]